MRRLFILSACVLAVSVASCQPKESDGGGASSGAQKQGGPGAKDDAYRRDLDRICDAERQSGAIDQEVGYRPMVVAQWLGRSIESQRGRDFLGKMARLAPKQKAELLRTEAAALGIADCPTAVAWENAAK